MTLDTGHVWDELTFHHGRWTDDSGDVCQVNLESLPGQVTLGDIVARGILAEQAERQTWSGNPLVFAPAHQVATHKRIVWPDYQMESEDT